MRSVRWMLRALKAINLTARWRWLVTGKHPPGICHRPSPHPTTPLTPNTSLFTVILSTDFHLRPGDQERHLHLLHDAASSSFLSTFPPAGCSSWDWSVRFVVIIFFFLPFALRHLPHSAVYRTAQRHSVDKFTLKIRAYALLGIHCRSFQANIVDKTTLA